MTMRTSAVAGLTAALLLSGCGMFGGSKSSEPPTGQVVARVDGQDVTIHEVNAEIATLNAPASTPRRDLERAALQQVINRRLLANAARAQKVDESPDFVMQRRRAEEALLVQFLSNNIVRNIAPVNRTDAQRFIESNPNLFGERKFLVVDQIAFVPPPNMQQLNLGGAKTMEAVEQVLTANNIEYRRAPSTIDAIGSDPRFINQVVDLLKRSPSELFMFPVPGANGVPTMLVNRVTEQRVIPFTGENAIRYAQSILQNQKVQQVLQQEAQKIEKAELPKVVYQKGYEPPAPGKGGAPAPAPKAGQPAAAPSPAAKG